MKRLLLAVTVILLGMMVLPSYAQAQQDFPRDITLSWVNPDSYVDDTPIEAGDLDIIHIDCYRQNDTVPMFSADVPDTGEGVSQTEVWAGVVPNPGTYRCEAFAFVDGISSDASNATFKKYTGKPKAVIDLTFL